MPHVPRDRTEKNDDDDRSASDYPGKYIAMLDAKQPACEAHGREGTEHQAECVDAAELIRRVLPLEHDGRQQNQKGERSKSEQLCCPLRCGGIVCLKWVLQREW